MLRESRKRLHDLSAEELLEISETLCHESIVAQPAYECIKVFARLREDGTLSYARHTSDLGTARVSAEEISVRIKDDARKNVVFEALCEVEKVAATEWPFVAGSSSWIQLEILDSSIRLKAPANNKAIVFQLQ